jgi:phosphoribosylaminoimidazolecarboxamide formyltransferase/IMP cyclohydrolase
VCVLSVALATVTRVPTALLSVYDKTGIVEFATALHELGWDLVSSGGTAKAIAATGVPVTDVADLTGVPAILDHRVVTLHPKIHGGLLADPTKPEHQADMDEYGISPISLVVVNLYPFSSAPGIELIDIGGPAMVRASAKNHAHVAIVVDPVEYEPLLDELRSDGEVSLATRRRLARDAFAHTAAYDAAIVTWFDQSEPEPEALPRTIHIALERAEVLRYGENPHQLGARYRFAGSSGWWDSLTLHGGKALSYLNLYDTEAAWRLVNRFSDTAVVIVKHANPCGVAVAGSVADAYVRADACDPVSAFGGIVAANRTVTADMAEALVKGFTEVLVAPAYDGDALAILATKKNMRVISAELPAEWQFDLKPLDGGFIVQQPDVVSLDRSTWTVATEAQPTEAQWADMTFAWQVCAAVSSNAIVFAKDGQSFGIGAGQQNRVDAARIAATRADGRTVGGACASDAFFPFRDTLDVAVAAGISAFIQPGGSMRDDESIAAANEAGATMVLTHQRHFRH